MEKLFAKVLALWWMFVIAAGFFGNIYMAAVAIDKGVVLGGVMFGALAVGCAALCYRTYTARAELRNILKD